MAGAPAAPDRLATAPDTVRLFVAIPLPPSVRERLHEAAAPLREAVVAAWTPPDRLHLTVKFLGSTDAARVPAIGAAIEHAVQRHHGVPLDLRGAGVFPTLRRPRVVWAGVEPASRLELLQHDVELACAELGFPLEGRTFRPHVTLGRLRAAPEGEGLRALARAMRRFAFEWRGEVSAVDLMASTLHPGGSRYRCLVSVPVRAR